MKALTLLKSMKFSHLIVLWHLVIFSCFPKLVYAQSLPDFQASFVIQVASFNLGIGTHEMHCLDNQCTLKSAAKPSGFITNFFKDEMYETSQFRQTENGLRLHYYQKAEVKYKGERSETKLTTLEVKDSEILSLEKNLRFAATGEEFDPMTLAYAIQWLKVNQRPAADFQKLKLQTNKQQSPLEFTSFAQIQRLRLDFANAPMQAEFYAIDTPRSAIQLWLVEELNWFPAKIEIFNKERNRTIILTLSKTPNYVKTSTAKDSLPAGE